MKALSVLLLCGSAALAAPQSVPDYVSIGPTAYMLAPAEVISSGACAMISWSDDGRYVAVLRTDLGSKTILDALANPGAPPDAEGSLIIYDVARRKSSVAWKARVREVSLPQVHWLKGTNRLVGVATKLVKNDQPGGTGLMTQRELLFVDAASGASSVIFKAETGVITIEPSPVKGLAIIGSASFVPDPKAVDSPGGYWEMRYRVLTDDGRLGAPLNSTSANMVGWAEDGVSPYLMRWSKSPEGNMVRELRVYNLQTGSSQLVDGQPKDYRAAPVKSALFAGPGNDALKLADKTRDVKPGWLATQDGSEIALVAGNVSEIALSPTLNAVAYVAEGAALLRPLVQVPKDALIAAKNAAERARVMSNAKQCATALIMYSTDNEDMMPSNQADVLKLMEPYLRNRDIMSGFVYSFGGGLLSDVKEPANTIMGYIPGPGGKAVVYIDGHVKWQSDQ